jgi:PAS domain-containing protein
MRKVDGRLTGRLAELALEASSNGVMITDALREDNPIIYVNPAFERIIGYAAGEGRPSNATAAFYAISATSSRAWTTCAPP